MSTYTLTPGTSRWASGFCDCCSSGACTCLYAAVCPCCAAGDVARGAGRDYCMSCCLIPAICPCLVPCQLNADRAALAARHNIDDPCGGFFGCFIFLIGFHVCALTQELSEIRLRRLQAGPLTVVVSGAPKYTDASPSPSYYEAPKEQTPIYYSTAGATYGAFHPPPAPVRGPSAPGFTS